MAKKKNKTKKIQPDSTSKRAFKITAKVTRSILETLQEVRCGN